MHRLNVGFPLYAVGAATLPTLLSMALMPLYVLGGAFDGAGMVWAMYAGSVFSMFIAPLAVVWMLRKSALFSGRVLEKRRRRHAIGQGILLVMNLAFLAVVGFVVVISWGSQDAWAASPWFLVAALPPCALGWAIGLICVGTARTTRPEDDDD